MTDEVNIDSDVAALLDAGVALAKPQPLVPTHGEAMAWLVPAGADVHIDDLQRLQANPTRLTGTALPLTVESFIDYVNRHAEAASTVWWDETTGIVRAVLNDHVGYADGEQYAGWGDHRAVLVLRTTPEWDFWVSADGSLMNQDTFAEHIEDGSGEIVEPDAATMLEIAQSFHAASAVNFRSATRLDSGTTQFLYDEEQTASAGKTGQLQVPTEFTIGVSPYVGEQPYRLPARLRYRVRSGGLSLGYKLERPERVLRDCIAGIALRLGEGLKDEVQIFAGTPKEPLA